MAGGVKSMGGLVKGQIVSPSSKIRGKINCGNADLE